MSAPDPMHPEAALMDAATRAQVTAAAPGRSTWLTANAGSGKTRVLTDRVARLLLNGAEPARILCLTYTKAAAAEMQNRLLERLGAWAMLPAPELTEALRQLGEPPPDAQALARARQLFARAIETPGGLKIQTIHAFCAGLLRRFPLEARVPHQFTEMDDRTAKLLAADLLEEMAEGPDVAALDDLATIFSGDRIETLTSTIISARAAFAEPLTRDQVLAMLDLAVDDHPDRLRADVLLGDEADLFAALIPFAAASSSNDQKLATALATLGGGPIDLSALPMLEGLFLYGATAKAGPYAAKIGAVPTKACQAKLPPGLLDRLEALMLRIEAARPRRLALAIAERTLILHRFARTFLHRYEAVKAARGWLDFDDLITAAGRLLSDQSVADWVLFRLDGGIDHVLVDEAQDTSSGQWRVIHRLTGEFTAGEGARRVPPTLFVVGDRKQSIYSFQGADLAEFDSRRAAFLSAFELAGRPMQDLTLAYSFRSSPAILDVVDATFAQGEAAQGLGGAPQHLAFHAEHPGRVDLWPAIQGDEAEKIEDYDDPVDLRAPDRPAVQLARALAQRIRRMIDDGECLPGRKPGDPARRIGEGDILILVQRRSDLFGAVIAACKAAGLAVAGADRLRLAAEIAVRDIRATLAFLSTPEDDLSLAEALRSPLFGWTEGQLFDLAHPRKGALWEELVHRGNSRARTVLTDLRNRSDFLRPHELIDRLLTRHRGRERLLARLGAEAEDGIDVLLAQALAYEQTEAPSLTGFLAWLDADEVQVKRRLDSAGGAIRVMTVHGAKGLESPIVILPDTAAPRAERPRPPLLTGKIEDQPMPPLWRGAKADRPPVIDPWTDAETIADAEERARLLYVAMTRAESWLIVAAAGEVDKPCWHADVARGLAACGARLVDDPGADGLLPGPVLRHAHGAWPAAMAGQAAVDSPLATVPADPAWLHQPAPPTPRLPAPVTATGLGGAKALMTAEVWSDTPGSSDLPGAGGDLLRRQAMAQGTALHQLLDLLPLAEDPQGLADRLGLDPDTVQDARDILAHADLDLADATILREATLIAPPPWPGAGPFRGSVDRLSITPDRVRVVDYKSNALVPDTADAIPEGILRQIGAYLWALGQIYPDRAAEAAILWTATGTLMTVPPDLAARAFAAAAPPAKAGALP